MNKNNSETILTYEENRILDTAIREILAEHVSDRIKLKKLRALQSTAQTPLGKSHITWHINRINTDRKRCLGRTVSIFVLAVWLVYMLYRTYLFLHPEQYRINSILGTTALQAAYGFLAIPAAILIYYIAVYIISSKDRAGKSD